MVHIELISVQSIFVAGCYPVLPLQQLDGMHVLGSNVCACAGIPCHTPFKVHSNAECIWPVFFEVMHVIQPTVTTSNMHGERGVQEAIVVATSERDGLDANLADAMRELQESAGNRTQVEAERAMMRQELEDAQSKVAALLQAKTAAEDKALAFEGQMEALQVCSHFALCVVLPMDPEIHSPMWVCVCNVASMCNRCGCWGNHVCTLAGD